MMKYLLSHSTTKTQNASTHTSPLAVSHCYPVTGISDRKKLFTYKWNCTHFRKMRLHFLPKSPLPDNLSMSDNYLLSKKSVCSSHSKSSFFFSFLSFFLLYSGLWPLERIKTDLVVQVFQSYHFPCFPLPRLTFIHRCMQNEKWKALTRVTYVNWCSMGFF